MVFVAGIYALRRIADIKVLFPRHSRGTFKLRNANLFCSARVNRRLKYYYGPVLHLRAN
jgi:hypothetical protein